MIIFGLALVAMFFLGIAYGKLSERKKWRNKNIDNPLEWNK
jgi:VIT1/CCC1 family predicted Fe2+/Mn2+ transporter